jgi:hypothetical protein
MFKENQNTSMKTEEAKGQQANQVSKMNAFAYLTSAPTKPISTSDKNGDNSENYPVIQNSEEEKTMFQENQNCSKEAEVSDVINENQINGSEATKDLPATSAQPMSIVDEKIENSRTRENSTTEASAKEKKLYDNINNIVKKCTTNTKKEFVKMWYGVGKEINGFYKKGYDKNEMKQASNNTGISTSALYKATQFANTFTNDDRNKLLEKDFISFRLIVESFPLGRFRALEVFESSNNAKEAQLKINEFKRRESDKGTNPDEGTDSKVPDSEKAPDSDVAADTVHEETDKEVQPADQPSSSKDPQSPDDQAEVAQAEGPQDEQVASGSEQPSSTTKTAKKKKQDTDASKNKEVSKPDFFGQTCSPDSFSYLFETMNNIGTKLVNTSVEKPAIGDLRKIIQNTMKELTNLLTLVPEATCAHSGVTLSGGTEWESSCQSAALPV